jgi:formylmethanofuran dehydrogenase subunit B
VLSVVATLLTSATTPLVYLAPELSCDAQREAVALADVLGAAIDSVSSLPRPLAGLLVSQEQGRLSVTLGEMRNRADLLVFWGTNPAITHPRFLSRYAEVAGRHLPDGRRSRRIVAVDVGDRRGPEDADVRVTIEPDNEADVLNVAAASAGPAPDGDDETTARARRITAAGIAEPRDRLLSALSGARYIAVIADGEAPHTGDSVSASALVTFIRALNEVTRAALVTLRGGGNRSGADAVLTWQTGFPVAVDFSRGYPDYRPYDGTGHARLSRNAADAVLIVGAPGRLPHDSRAGLFARPCAAIGPLGDTSHANLRAVIDTGVAGIHEAGLAYRMDDVPVRLRAVLGGRPSPATLLRSLRQRCLES